MLQIQIGSTSTDPRYLNKDFTIAETANCYLKDSCSLFSPQFVLDYKESYVSCNYLYVPAWSRYYFINNSTFDQGGKIILNCTVDVLMSFQSSIKDLSPTVVRQEYWFNSAIPDPMFCFESDYSFGHYLFPDQPLAVPYNDNNTYYLIQTIGGYGRINSDGRYHLIQYDSQPSNWSTNWKDYWVKDWNESQTNFTWLSLSSPFPNSAPPWDLTWNSYGGIYYKV